jgi:hypothetical protein
MRRAKRQIGHVDAENDDASALLWLRVHERSPPREMFIAARCGARHTTWFVNSR